MGIRKASVTIALLLYTILAGSVSSNFISTSNGSSNNAIADWKPPHELVQKFPYYFSGFDEEDRPILVCEFGKWDLMKYFGDRNSDIKLLEKYTDQAFHFFIHGPGSGKHASTEAPDGTLLLVDMDNFQIRQMSSAPALQFMTGLTKKLGEAQKHLAHGFIVNANYVAESAYHVGRPLLGRALERLEVYGTNSAKWIPRLLRVIPRDQLPPWYGGDKDFVPIAVYG